MSACGLKITVHHEDTEATKVHEPFLVQTIFVSLRVLRGFVMTDSFKRA